VRGYAAAQAPVSGASPGPVRRTATEYLIERATALLRARTLEAERAASEEAQRRWNEERNRPENVQARREQQERADEEYWRAREEIEGRFTTAILQTLGRFAQELEMEWTRELLESTFAPQDGTRVNWDDATVEQHRERVEIFKGNAILNSEGAARHLKAIEAGQAAGVGRRRDLVWKRALDEMALGPEEQRPP